MKIQITADRMIDLTDEELQQLNIKTMPCFVHLGDKSYLDMQDVFPVDIFRYLRETGKVAKTAAQSPQAYAEFFDALLDKDTAIIHFAASSGISSICSHAIAASKMTKGKVLVVDTKTLGNGIALLVKYAMALIEGGEHNPEIIHQKCVDRLPHVQASFLLDSLLSLRKGGRCSAMQFFGANLLHIKPTIFMDLDGKMKIREKRRGKLDFAIKSYIKDTFEKYKTPVLDAVYIEESTPNEEIRNLMREEIAKYHTFEHVYFYTTSCNCSIHSGENTVAMFFFNDAK